jgi:hypothetical protein
MKQAVTRRLVTRETECPVCGAFPNERCTGVDKYAYSIHRERWVLFYDRNPGVRQARGEADAVRR